MQKRSELFELLKPDITKLIRQAVPNRTLGGGSGGGASLADITAAISAHVAAPDPHSLYLTQPEGDARYSLLGHMHDDRYYTESESDARFVRLATAGTITAQHSFAPATAQAPFVLSANAQGQVVTGLRADQLNRTLFAGSGLTGAGLLTTDVTIQVGEGDGIVVNANDVAVRRYVDSGLTFGLDGGLTLGTPIAVSINTTSAVTGVQHSHAVIASSNPGASPSLLATSASGALTLNNGGSTINPALTIGDGSTGRMAIGSGGWRDTGSNFELLGAHPLSVGSNRVWGTSWEISASGVATLADNTDTQHRMGMAQVGYVGYAGYAGFAHRLMGSAGNYALMQSGTGDTYLNAASTKSIYHRINNADVMAMGVDRLNPAGSIVKDLGDYNRKWRTLYAAELYVETLVAQDVISTIGGRIMVAPTTTLIADLSAAATTIDVKHNALVIGDYIYMAAAPGGIAQVEAMKITSSATAITGGYRYSVTRNLDGSGANAWVAGDAVADLGGTVGSGYIDLTATSTLHNHLGPTMTIYSRTSTATWNGVKPTVSAGNLRSFVDYSSDTMGIAHGNDLTLSPTGGFSGMTSDNSNGMRLFNTTLSLYAAGNLFLKLDTATGFTIKSGTGTSLPTSSIYGMMWYRDTLGGNKSAYIASIYDTTNPSTALRGNNLFVTSYDSPAGPSQLNIIAIDEGNAFSDQAQITMIGGKPSLSMSSNIAVQATQVTLAGGGRSLTVNGTGVFIGTVNAGITVTNGYGATETNLKSEISNDALTYKALMLLGNRSGDSATRRVNIYDHAFVNHRIKIGGTSFESGNLNAILANNNSTASSVGLANTGWGNSAHVSFNCYLADTAISYSATGAWRYYGSQYAGNVTAAGLLSFDGNGNRFHFKMSETGLSSGSDITTWSPIMDIYREGIISILGASAGGAVGAAIALKNVTTAPASNPTGGGVLYVQSGALKYKGSSGTITTLAVA